MFSSARKHVLHLVVRLAVIVGILGSALGVAVATNAQPASAQTSSWFQGNAGTSQNYGCTSVTFEDPKQGARHGCTSSAPNWHSGVDLTFWGTPGADSRACGSPLYAPVPMTVIAVPGPDRSPRGGFGPSYPVLQLDDSKTYIILGHVTGTVVRAGDKLKPGALIAYVSTQGNSTGCHLHFEARKATGGGVYGTDIDPMPFLTGAALRGATAPSVSNVAFQTNTGHLYTRSSAGATADTNIGMRPVTSPSVAALPSGGYVVAVQANTGHLYTLSPAGVPTDTNIGMMAGTSPSVAAVGSGYVVAVQANTGHLYTLSPSGVPTDTNIGMMAGTSPSVAALPSGGYVVAVQANTGHLYTLSPSGVPTDTNIGMRSGTSPSVAAVGSGYVVAVQANTGHLYTLSPSGVPTDTNIGMKAGTSPSVAALPSGGYVVAVQADTGHLYTLSPSGVPSDTNLGMMTGTSPTVTAIGSGYEVAVQATTGHLYTLSPSGVPTDTNQGMSSGTSPSIA